MQVTIVGAGAVGLQLALRLAAAGTSTHLVTRRPDVAEAIARDGGRLVDPADGRSTAARPDRVSAPADHLDLGDGPVLLCVRTGETARLARELAGASPSAVVASAQNDVGNEAILAEHFAHVLGIVVRQTCTLRDARTVLATGRGRIVIGDHPAGVGPVAQALADRFETAGFDVGRSARIGQDKWLKLVHNLMSAVNALVRRPDHTTEAFVELKIRLVEEAREALAAAGIEARPCDGRDRSIEQEIEHLRGSLADGTSARDLPLYNACWAALRDPARPLEADAYHRRIVGLADAHGTAAPANRALLEAVTRAWADRHGPECMGARELLARAKASPR